MSHFTLSFAPSGNVALSSARDDVIFFWQTCWQNFVIYKYRTEKTNKQTIKATSVLHQVTLHALDVPQSLCSSSRRILKSRSSRLCKCEVFFSFKTFVVEECGNINGNTGSRLEFEQGDVSTIGPPNQFLQVPHLSGRLSGSFRVDSQHDLVGRRPCGPAADSRWLSAGQGHATYW